MVAREPSFLWSDAHPVRADFGESFDGKGSPSTVVRRHLALLSSVAYRDALTRICAADIGESPRTGLSFANGTNVMKIFHSGRIQNPESEHPEGSDAPLPFEVPIRASVF